MVQKIRFSLQVIEARNRRKVVSLGFYRSVREKTNVALSGTNSTWPRDKQEHPESGQNAKNTLIWACMAMPISWEKVKIEIRLNMLT